MGLVPLLGKPRYWAWPRAEVARNATASEAIANGAMRAVTFINPPRAFDVGRSAETSIVHASQRGKGRPGAACASSTKGAASRSAGLGPGVGGPPMMLNPSLDDAFAPAEPGREQSRAGWIISLALHGLAAFFLIHQLSALPETAVP